MVGARAGHVRPCSGGERYMQVLTTAPSPHWCGGERCLIAPLSSPLEELIAPHSSPLEELIAPHSSPLEEFPKRQVLHDDHLAENFGLVHAHQARRRTLPRLEMADVIKGQSRVNQGAIKGDRAPATTRD